jgi:hypothetical protein
MNEIAFVEFEASHPLFFDPYEQNRTTGSAILIDPLTNATVGALMIREPLSVEAQSSLGHEASRTQVGLTDRVPRRGHRPAIFALWGERASAEAVERSLFDRGFETVFVNHNEIPSAARDRFFTTLWNLGLLIVSWSPTRFRPRDRGVLVDIAGDLFFDLSSVKESTGGTALRIAESLRTNSNPSLEGEN